MLMIIVVNVFLCRCFYYLEQTNTARANDQTVAQAPERVERKFWSID